MTITVPRLVLAGTHSGVGKTTVTVGILRALSRRGMALQAFKVGPDFLDPTYHREALGVPSGNLDSWMAGPSFLKENLASHSVGKDLVVIEGVMGLFDGRGAGGEGSTAEVAKLLGAPVILIVDCKGTSRSAAAQVLGFQAFDRKVKIAGVVLNRTGSKSHHQTIREALEGRTGIPVLGALPKDAGITLSHRHLGLVSADGTSLPNDLTERLADLVENNLDLERLVSIARAAPELTARARPRRASKGRVKIGVARDEAFHFYYAENLELLEREGAEIVPFSPLHDASPPEGLDGVYLGGGYPELHLRQLAARTAMRGFIRSWALSGGPLYAECGGFLYLLDEIIAEGERFPMAGVFPFRAELRERRAALGYVEVEAARDTILLEKGGTMRGHVFHYTEIGRVESLPEGMEAAYRVTRTDGRVEECEGFTVGSTLASYVHLYFPSRPEAARRFVERCRSWKKHGK